jgi:hypothetical protein
MKILIVCGQQRMESSVDEFQGAQRIAPTGLNNAAGQPNDARSRFRQLTI